jgi:hypothetical protein
MKKHLSQIFLSTLTLATLLLTIKPNVFAARPATHGLRVAGNHLHVVGNHFVDANGNIVILRGAARWSLEFSCGDRHFNTSDFQAMKSWGMNIVRLPLNESYLLFPNLCGGTKYIDTVKQAISRAEAVGMYVLLDLHWISPFDDNRGGQYPMPDMKAKQFWQTLATMYKNDSRVLYEMMNEPHPNYPHPIDCNIWKNGGDVTSGNGQWSGDVQAGTYPAVGFQELADLIHGIAPNAVIIQGASEEADISCAQSHPLTGTNIAYQSHFYGTDPNDWVTKFQSLTSKVPVIGGEFNIKQGIKVPQVFEKLETGYIAWAWEGCKNMTSDCYGTPSDNWQTVHDFMSASTQNTCKFVHLERKSIKRSYRLNNLTPLREAKRINKYPVRQHAFSPNRRCTTHSWLL